MDSIVGKAERSWGVRGNIFSCLLPWEHILSQLYRKVEDGDLSDWPLSPETVLHLVRVRFIRLCQCHYRIVDRVQNMPAVVFVWRSCLASKGGIVRNPFRDAQNPKNPIKYWVLRVL